ncbi:hypothetical protein BDW62DRAFT_196626 [Aspergillus aurantiobrunneus]
MASSNPSKQSASTTQVPTIRTLRDMKRSVSYNAAVSTPEDRIAPPSGQKVDEAGCSHMLKASLTGLLNCSEVKSEARERKVQNMLMSTEKDARETRRKTRRAQSERRYRALLDPMESIRRSEEYYKGIG